MICPACDGGGRVRVPFLLFFTRLARCARCLGTGEFPPRVGPVRVAPDYRDDEPFGGLGSSTSVPREREDGFEVGSGGRSGGGGAAASWGSATDADAPVIVDPFSAGGSTAGDVAATESFDSGASTDDNSSSADTSGTSY
jgi:hypothetical protein